MTGYFLHNNEVGLLRSSLTELRGKSLRRILAVVGMACYVGIAWALWPTTVIDPVRLSIGIMSVGLAALLLVLFFASRRFVGIVSLLLIISLLICIYALAIVLRRPEVTYLFIVPVLTTSIILGQESIFIVTLASIVLTVRLAQMGISHLALIFPLVILGVVAVLMLITIRNLYTALQWALSGYEAAFRNQEIARDRKAELEQVLKSLDIATTNLHRTNHALTIARRQADEARQAKQQFAQAISHELRTPLNLIVGFTETMMQSPEYYGGVLPVPYLRDLSIVYRNSCHLQSLINDVLDLARIETAQMSLQLEEEDLNILAEEAVNTARSLVESRGLTFSAEIQPNLPTVWVDAVRLKQIMINLLNNAARYTEEGGITFSMSREEDQVIFTVADTGIGISSDDLERIFEPFSQLGNAKRKPTGGVGLGLAISRNLAQMHNGTIRVESELGKGSVFQVCLPLTSTHPSSPALEYHSAFAHHSAAPNYHTSDHVVLLVTRSLSASTLVSRYLQPFRAITVSSLEQAEPIAKQMLPQAVIVDVQDDLLNTDQLRSLAFRWNLPQTYIIACSLPGEEGLRRRLSSTGFLIKPVSRERLMDVLNQFGGTVTNILIVDDDRDFVHLLERMLQGALQRYEVTAAYSGQEALSLIDFSRPDLIILDIQMPDMSGIEVLERINAHETWKNIRVVVVSAQERFDEADTTVGNIVVTRATGVSLTETLLWFKGILGA